MSALDDTPPGVSSELLQQLVDLRSRVLHALRNVYTEEELAESRRSVEMYESFTNDLAEEWLARERENLRLSEEGVRLLPVIDQATSELDRVLEEDWQAACSHSVVEGVYTVTLTRLGERRGVGVQKSFERLVPLTVAVHAGVPFRVAQELLKRVQHVGPENIVEGVSLDDAIAVKTDLERWATAVKIKEGARPRSAGRVPIPERVRREVWRRDGGRCVDCSSRERLEFDHIIPVSRGGSNTARNIELRCETCNRRKAASI